MPSLDLNVYPYKPSRKQSPEWNTFKDGLVLILRPTELSRSQYSQGDNILLEGSGVPTGRWGTAINFSAGATGPIQGMGTFIKNTTNEFLAFANFGYGYKKNGSGSTAITGQSWPSGSIIRTEQLGGETYIVSERTAFTKYSGTSFSCFATVKAPTGLYATNISGVTGAGMLSYKLVANVPTGGHTEPSTNYVLYNVPSDLTLSAYKISWTAPSAATLSGYELYRGNVQGDETFLTGLAGNATSFTDYGEMASPTVAPPMTNTTGGIASPIIKKYQNRLLVVSGSTLYISAKYPDHTSFALMDGGGEVSIDPDSGDDITGVEVQPIADRIVVYKNRSSYLVKLDFVTVGPFYLMDPSYSPISTSVGCSNQDAIATVENDTFYFGRDGIYVTGYEPNFLNIIRTNEVSARVRPYFDRLNVDDYENCCAMYVDHKYILSFPRLREILVYDRERGCFAGIWKLPFGISHMKKYVDASGSEHWVIGSSEANIVYDFVPSLNSDDGSAIIKTIRSNKEDFGDWTRLSILEYFYILFRAITGTVTVNIIGEDRDGNNSTIKTFTITGSETAGISGWGSYTWGGYGWGNAPAEYSTPTDEVTRWGSLFKQIRSVQVEVTTSSLDSNFELLNMKMSAQQQPAGTLSASQRV